MSGHIQNPVENRGKAEIEVVEKAFGRIPRGLCIGTLCAFYNDCNGHCEASQTPIQAEVDTCTQTAGPVRLERA